MFVISKPDVFKSPGSDTFIIFGEAKIEDIHANGAQDAASTFKMPDAASAGAADLDDMPALEDAEAPAKKAAAPAIDESGPVDETGLDAEDIETVMAQASCSRAKAVRALKQHSNLVDAILVSCSFFDS